MMQLSTLRRGAIAIMAGLLTASCGADSALPSAPSTPSLEVVDPAVFAEGLTRDVALRQDITVGAWINKDGGKIEIRDAGLKLTIPSGAVRHRTYFQITAHSGRMVAYSFGPHGSVFKKGLLMEQVLRGTSWDKLPSHSQVEIGYFENAADLDLNGHKALIREFLPIEIDVTGSAIKAKLFHFSGYMVSSGRMQAMEE
jgi:hypothetical protein